MDGCTSRERKHNRFSCCDPSDVTWFMQCWRETGDPLLHIEVRQRLARKPRLLLTFSASNEQLRRWADIVLVAPCDANTLAKIANGIYDNLAVSVSVLSVATSLNLIVTVTDVRPTCSESKDADVLVPSDGFAHARTSSHVCAYGHDPRRHRI